MQQIFNVKTSIILYFFFGVLGILVSWAFKDWAPSSLLGSIFPGLGIGAFLLTIIGHHRVFNHIWKWKWFQKLTFTYVGGDWEGSLKSNWGLVKALYDHAQLSKKLDANDLSFDKQATPPINVKVKITAGLFRVHMKLTVLNANDSRESHSMCMQMIKDSSGKENLYYVYKQTTAVPPNTDESEHIGAAAVEVKHRDDGQTYLEGTYWTARSWQRGLNTAGRIELTRPK